MTNSKLPPQSKIVLLSYPGVNTSCITTGHMTCVNSFECMLYFLSVLEISDSKIVLVYCQHRMISLIF